MPMLEYQFAKAAMGRKWAFDFSWETVKRRVALEVEGGIWLGHTKKGMGSHARPIHFVKDMEKYNAAASLGWFVFRVQPKDLCLVSTAAMIKKALYDC